MSHPEMSLSFSAAQLLSLKVRLDFTDTDQPPNMSLEACEQGSSNDTEGPLIKLDTSIVDGHRVVKLYAVDSPSKVGQGCSISSPASSSTSPTATLPPDSADNRGCSNSIVDIEMRTPTINGWSFPKSMMHQYAGTPSALNTSCDMPSLSENVPATVPVIIPEMYSSTFPGSFDEGLPLLPIPGYNFDDLGAFGGSLDFGFGAPAPCPSPLSSRVSLDFGEWGQSDMDETDQSSIGTTFSNSPVAEISREITDHEPADASGRMSTSLTETSEPGTDTFADSGLQFTGLHTPAETECGGSPQVRPVVDNDSVEEMSNFSEVRPSPPRSFSRESTPELPTARQLRSQDPAHQRRKISRTLSKPAIYHCPNEQCTRVFRSEYTCRVHSSVHIPKLRKVVHCTTPGCAETFTRQHDRLRHEVSQHGKVCEWSCLTCLHFFSSAQMLQKHKCASFRR